MKKAATLAAILAACALFNCAKVQDASTQPDPCTFHFKYGQLIRVLEDPDGQNETYRDAAHFYCFTESDHHLLLFSSLDLDTTYFEPITMAYQVLRWSIGCYQGPQAHYQGDVVVQAWFSDTVTRANFDFTFRVFTRRSR